MRDQTRALILIDRSQSMPSQSVPSQSVPPTTNSGSNVGLFPCEKLLAYGGTCLAVEKLK